MNGMIEYILTPLVGYEPVSSYKRNDTRPTFKEGKLWWCSIGMNIGVESTGKGERFTRPIILKKFNTNSFIGIPLTTRSN